MESSITLGYVYMNLNQLKLFYFTAKYNSPSAAAEYLNISQPAVTTGIHRLEEYYDVKLFQRDGRSLALTEAGEALHKLAEKIFEIELLAEDCIGNFQAIPLCDSSITRTFYLIHHKDKYIFKALENLLSTMKTWATEYSSNMQRRSHAIH